MAWSKKTPSKGRRPWRRKSTTGLETKQHARRTFATKRTTKEVLFAFSCDRIVLCPQSCCLGGVEECPDNLDYNFQVIDYTTLAGSYQDSVRLTSLHVKMWWTPFIAFDQGSTLAQYAAKRRQASWLWRSALAKQVADGPFGSTPGVVPRLALLDPYQWSELPLMHRKEVYHHAYQESIQAGSDIQLANNVPVALSGTVESCCPLVSGVIGGGGGAVVGGEGIIAPVSGEINTECVPCESNNFDVTGTLAFPPVTNSGGSYIVPAQRGFTQEYRHRGALVLKEYDSLNQWVSFGGLGLIDQEACGPTGADETSIDVGFIVTGYVNGTVEL